MQDDWKKFIKSLPHEIVFLHRDEFHKQYPGQKSVSLPAVFVATDTGLRILIPHTEINQAEDIKDLIATVKRFLPK